MIAIRVSQMMPLAYAADIEVVERRNRLWQRSRSLYVSQLPRKVRKQSCGVKKERRLLRTGARNDRSGLGSPIFLIMLVTVGSIDETASLAASVGRGGTSGCGKSDTHQRCSATNLVGCNRHRVDKSHWTSRQAFFRQIMLLPL